MVFNKGILIHFPFFPNLFPPFSINYLYLKKLFHFSWSSFSLSGISWFQEISWKVASLIFIDWNISSCAQQKDVNACAQQENWQCTNALLVPGRRTWMIKLPPFKNPNSIVNKIAGYDIWRTKLAWYEISTNKTYKW